MMHYEPTMLAIGSERQLFVDDLLIETVHEITRTFHRPTKTEQSPIIVKDKPWEKVTYFSGGAWNVFRDPEDGLFKCLYSDYRLDRDDWKASGGLSLKNHMLTVNYAVSKDGIRWKKPSLGLLHENGQDTNIVFGNGAVESGAAYSFCPVHNPHEPDPDKRLRTLYWAWNDRRGMHQHVAFSPDAIHWTISEQPLNFGSAPGIGDVLIADYNPKTRLYVASVRHHFMSDVQFNLRNPKGRGFLAFEPYYPLDFSKSPKRMVWQIESGDFIHWSEPHLILAPVDGVDNIDDEFYGMAQYPLGSLRLGFLNVFHKTLNTMDVQLVYTRDGYQWHRLNKCQPLLEPGLPGSWDQYMTTIVSQPIEVGDKLYIYHGGSQSHHDWWMSGPLEGLDVPEVHDFSKVGYGLGLAQLRLDGFASLDASAVREGILVTRPFLSTGNRLIINADVREGGYIDVEATDGADEIIPGRSRDACDTCVGDSVRHEVTWRGDSHLPLGKSNRFRKLRFFMHKADLYSFQMFHPERHLDDTKYPGTGWQTA